MPEETQPTLSPQDEAALQAHEDYITEQGGAEAPGRCEAGTWYALIERDEITDIFDGASLPEYNPRHLHLIALPKGEEFKYCRGLKLVEGVLQPMSLEQAKARQLEKINAAFEQAIYNAQKDFFPLEEVLSFEIQRQEAALFEVEGAQTPFLDKLAEERGEDKAALVKKIVEKHNAYINTLATLMGKRHKARDMIEQAGDFEAVIRVEYN